MISVKTYNVEGASLKDTSLPKEVFGVEVNPVLIAQAVRVYLANQRRGLAKTKTRSDVNKTTAKMYRQKGTGRARHGSYAAPIFVGGGIAHGPDGNQNYRLKMPENMRRIALLGALSSKAAQGEIKIITGASSATGKTKQVSWLDGKSLVVTTKDLTNFNRAARNLANTSVISADSLNTYQVLAHKNLILAEEAIENLKKHYS
jgi:large subunit ribosomal protein L4